MSGAAIDSEINTIEPEFDLRRAIIDVMLMSKSTPDNSEKKSKDMYLALGLAEIPSNILNISENSMVVIPDCQLFHSSVHSVHKGDRQFDGPWH